MATSIEITGDPNKALAALQAVIGKQQGMIDSLRRTVRESKDAGKAHESSFGAQAVGQLKTYAMQLVSVGAAAAAIKQAFVEARQAQRAFSEGITGAEQGAKRLAQVAGSPLEFAQLRNRAKQIAVSQGIAPNEAMQLLFQIKSQGLEQDTQVLASTSRFTNAESMTEAAGKLRAAFGEQETGRTSAVVSKLLAAAKSSDVSVEDIARAASVATAGASRVGATDEELLALLSTMSPAFRSPEVAAGRISAISGVLAKGIEVEGQRVTFADRGILGGLQEFQSKYPEQFQTAMAGREEAAQGLEIIENNRATIAARFREISQAGATEAPLATALAIADAPALRAAREARAAKISRELAGEGAGLGELAYQRQKATTQEFFERRFGPAGGVLSAGVGMALEAERVAGFGPTSFVSREVFGGDDAPGAGVGQTLVDLMREQTELAKEQVAQTRQQNGGKTLLRNPNVEAREGNANKLAGPARETLE